jgi:hypothetical protein
MFIDVSEEIASSIFRAAEDWDATLCILVEVIATFRSNELSPSLDRTVSLVLLFDPEDGDSSSETSGKTISLRSVTSQKTEDAQHFSELHKNGSCEHTSTMGLYVLAIYVFLRQNCGELYLKLLRVFFSSNIRFKPK